MSYEHKEIVLEPSDSALLYSDGLVSTTPMARCSASLGLGHSLPSTVRRDLWEALLEALSSSLGKVGAGGRHHPPYATTLRIPKLNFPNSVNAKFAKHATANFRRCGVAFSHHSCQQRTEVQGGCSSILVCTSRYARSVVGVTDHPEEPLADRLKC